jgi:hypothetical protein
VRQQEAAPALKLLSSDLLRLDHLTAAVHAVRADVVTQTGFARAVVNDHVRCHEGVVRAMHAAFRRRFFILLNGHDGLLELVFARQASRAGKGYSENAAQGVANAAKP